MSNAKSIEHEINEITAALIGAGLCADQNWPSAREANHRDGQIIIIGIFGADDLSFALKNVSYAETYAEFCKRRCFNLRMVDGGLIQFLYTFQQGALVKHSLGFHPSPTLLEFQNNPEIYREDVLYAEVVERNIVVSPIRVDFDPERFKEYYHPKSHLTIGQYKNCRIPVSAPLTPFQFINFILRAFYNTAFETYCGGLRPRADFFDVCITEYEASLPHVRLAV
jgi:hypothetical protein